MYSKEILTKEKAIELLKTEYAFEQGKVKDSYQEMYPDKRHLEYKFDGFVDFLKIYYFGETSDVVTFKINWDQWKDNFCRHYLKSKTDHTNSTKIEEILRKEISEEMISVWKLLYLDSDKNYTIPDLIRSYTNTSSLQNKQQYTDETVQTPEEAQQEKERIFTLLIKKQLIDRKEIKGKSEYRLTASTSIPDIYKWMMEKVKNGSLSMTEQDIYKFLKTLKDKNGHSTNDAANTLKSRNKKRQANSNKP
ncbi:MAG: hypothetical protein LBD80_02870 [Tannerella sp.]|nr:hypothetical protein [Tannerella sp.]